MSDYEKQECPSSSGQAIIACASHGLDHTSCCKQKKVNATNALCMQMCTPDVSSVMVCLSTFFQAYSHFVAKHEISVVYGQVTIVSEMLFGRRAGRH